MAMNHHQRRSVPRLLTPIALSIVLSACSTQPSSPDVVDITAQPLLTAQTYLMRADASQGNQQNDWLIMALKAAIEENNPDQAQLLIMRLAKQPLTPTQQAQWQLLRAQLLANTEQYQEALEQLSSKPIGRYLKFNGSNITSFVRTYSRLWIALLTPLVS